MKRFSCVSDVNSASHENPYSRNPFSSGSSFSAEPFRNRRSVSRLVSPVIDTFFTFTVELAIDTVAPTNANTSAPDGYDTDARLVESS